MVGFPWPMGPMCRACASTVRRSTTPTVVRRCRARPRQGRALDGQLGRGIGSPWRSRPRADCLTQGRGRAQPLLRPRYLSGTARTPGVIGTALSIEQKFFRLRRRRLAEGRNLGAYRGDLTPRRRAAAQLIWSRPPTSAWPASPRPTSSTTATAPRRSCAAPRTSSPSWSAIPRLSTDFVDHFRGDETDFDYGWEPHRRRGLLEDRAARRQGGAGRLQAEGQRDHPVHHAQPDARHSQADGQGLRHRRGRGARPSGRHARRYRRGARAGHAGRCAGDRQEGDRKMVGGLWPGRRHPGVRGHGRERQACPSARACRAGSAAQGRRRTT